MRRRFFTARDGLRLSALEWDGPEEALPLLCLPGLSRTALDYVSTAERHAATRRVVALDYAGHGESAKAPLARYTIPNTLGDVLDCMAALRVPRAVVIGTSLGGLLGMVLSVLRPGALAGLVLNDSGPRIDAGGLSGAREVIGSDPRLGSIEECIAYLRRLLPETGIPDDRWIDAAETTYWRGEDGRYRPRWDTGLIQALPKSGSGPTELWPMFEALPDLPVPATDPHHPLGNHVVLDCAGTVVTLAHLRQGSLSVRQGQRVEQGTVVASVGNSGESREPHLAISARRRGTALLLGGEAMPMRFDGRYLTRNQRHAN
jgi:pimeloyl-ACP methyl ester carboxylesterase